MLRSVSTVSMSVTIAAGPATTSVSVPSMQVPQLVMQSDAGAAEGSTASPKIGAARAMLPAAQPPATPSAPPRRFSSVSHDKLSGSRPSASSAPIKQPAVGGSGQLSHETGQAIFTSDSASIAGLRMLRSKSHPTVSIIFAQSTPRTSVSSSQAHASVPPPTEETGWIDSPYSKLHAASSDDSGAL